MWLIFGSEQMIFNTENVEIQIKDYFYRQPIDRLRCYKSLAAQIVTVDSVILVLDWGADDGTRTIEDAWAGAVDLLSEVDDVLLQVLESEEFAQWRRGGFSSDVRQHRAIAMLTEGIAVASRIPTHLRLVGVIKCWSEFKQCNRGHYIHEQDKNKAKVVSAIIRAIEISDLNDLKDYLVPLLIESKVDEQLDAFSKLVSP